MGAGWTGAAIALCATGCLVSVPDASLIDAPDTCSSNSECTAPTAFCNLTLGTCVECLEASTCPIERPVCGPLGACDWCETDAECPSMACLPDGTCADPARLLYATPNGAGSQCATTAPCALSTAFDTADDVRNVIVAAPGTYPAQGPNDVAILLATGATIEGEPKGSAFAVGEGADLTIVGATIRGGWYGVSCDGVARVALHRTVVTENHLGIYSSCDVAVTRSRIEGNTQVGIYAQTRTLSIANSFITGNGGENGFPSIGGGVVFASAANGRVELSTLAGNTGMGGAGGITCDGTHTALVITSSILYGNTGGPSATAVCPVDHSVVDDYTGTGVGNVMMMDPRFADATTGNYRIQSGSPARGAADPTVVTPIDHDGDPRPQPAATPADCGADEILD